MESKSLNMSSSPVNNTQYISLTNNIRGESSDQVMFIELVFEHYVMESYKKDCSLMDLLNTLLLNYYIEYILY